MDDALRVIAESHDYICAERLTPRLVGMARHLAARQELALTPALEEQLARISVYAVKRKPRWAPLDRLSSLPNAKHPQNVLQTLSIPIQKGSAS